MRYVTCSSCAKDSIPLNNSVSVDGVVLCQDCFSETFNDKALLKGRQVLQELDPTVCVSCNKDFGDTALRKMGTYPVCDTCTVAIEKRVMPTWVKAFFAAVVLIVVFSFYWNSRFFQAHEEINNANAAFQRQEYRLAADLMSDASNHVREMEDLRHMKAYFSGIACLTEDKSTEAVDHFKSCLDFMPKDFDVSILLQQAELGSAFDKKDYHQFLMLSKMQLERDTTNVINWGSVASAYACLYATTGKDSLKTLAHIYLAHVEADTLDPTAPQYLQRIRHRLATREIITKKEYDKRFPIGWRETEIETR